MDSEEIKELLMPRSKSNEIWVTDFTEKHAQRFREQVLKQAGVDPNRPIVIYIDSYGGYVDSLAKMVETIDELPNPIITVCMGKAMSCGAMLLSHGDYRYCSKHSRIMVHEVSHGAIGDVHDVHADAIEGKRLNKYWLGILAENCGMNGYEALRRRIKEMDGRDMYLQAKEALDFGIIDKVGTPLVVPLVQYSIETCEAERYHLEGGRGTKKKIKKRK